MERWATIIPSIVKFLLITLPSMIEYWIKVSNERNYSERIREVDARVAEYKKTKSLESLNELAK